MSTRSCHSRSRDARTDRPIAEELVRAGIPKEDIVLAEQPADVRPFTRYGVG